MRLEINVTKIVIAYQIIFSYNCFIYSLNYKWNSL